MSESAGASASRRSRRRVLVYVQHLSGVGHLVRIDEIVRALAEHYEVFLVQGGRPVPRRRATQAPEILSLPQIRRGAHGLESVEAGRPIDTVLEERSELLRSAAARIAPDLLIVEHYPFSKWELEAEIGTLIEAARAANPNAVVLCSTRDICGKTRHESAPAEGYEARVAARLNERFDALLVHADPAFARLEDHFAGVHEFRIPVHYTGFVSQKIDGPCLRTELGPQDPVVLSCGGGAGSAPLIGLVLEAWKVLREQGATGERVLTIFPGLFWQQGELEKLRGEAGDHCRIEPFGPRFLPLLSTAAFSISRAGYNTCANLLETRRRALLLPDMKMSDQPIRARHFERLGLARSVFEPAPAVATLAAAITDGLRGPAPQHDFDLDGACGTRRVVDELLGRSAG